MTGVIKDGVVVVIQRYNYMRTYKMNFTKSTLVQMGKDSIDLACILGQKYGSTFKMVPHTSQKKGWQLELTEEMVNDMEDLFLKDDCGQDNRDLLDSNSQTQGLSREDIEEMKDKCMDGTEIVGQLIEKSSSFSQKTKFSQAKFLKKKAKKYCQYVAIKRPSVRLLMQIHYKADPIKLMNMRMDSLAQLLNSANVRAGGKYIIYETGCQGIVVASALQRIVSGGPRGGNGSESTRGGNGSESPRGGNGSESPRGGNGSESPRGGNGSESPRGGNGSGKLVHVFQTGTPQTQSLSAMNFDQETLDNSLCTINMYHLRALEQGKNLTNAHNEGGGGGQVPFRQKQREESIVTYESVLKEKRMDGLVIACKQHPTNLLLALIKYLAPSRPFVVYSPYKEPLMDAYMAAKDTGKTVMVTLTETWLRNYQVLPDRTHPEVLMSGGGGYILSGIVVDNSEPEGYTNGGAAEDGGGGGKKNKRFRRR